MLALELEQDADRGVRLDVAARVVGELELRRVVEREDDGRLSGGDGAEPARSEIGCSYGPVALAQSPLELGAELRGVWS